MDPSSPSPDDPVALVHRLCAATNAHDLDALVACFASDYRNETPVHPERGFVGAVQVRRNWAQIFAAIPDLTTAVVGVASAGDTVWSEWEHRGTRSDGSAHVMRGVVIFGVEHRQAVWARFYLEPVQDGAGGVDEAVRRQVVPGPPT
jgi:ketosteroid isomerase-like protein